MTKAKTRITCTLFILAMVLSVLGFAYALPSTANTAFAADDAGTASGSLQIAEIDATKAAKTKTVLTFTSDIHNASNNTAANRLDGWLDNVIEDYGGVDVMSFCGDMGEAGDTSDRWWTYVQAVKNVVDDKELQGIYTTGNHEFYNGKFNTTSNAVKGIYTVGEEAINGDNYRIYCLGTDNWNNNSDNYTTAQVDLLSSYLSSVGSDKPIIILTHFPLHYFSSGSGSSWGGWGGGRQTTNADLVIDTLNAAAADGKTIILLWGHNHTVSDTHYDEMYKPGSTIEYKSGSTKVFNFYYGAAGCMSDSEYGSGSAFVKGKGLVIAIDSNNKLEFAYYDANGNNVTEGDSGGDDPGNGDEPQTGQGVIPQSGKKYVILANDGYALTSEGDGAGYTNGGSGDAQYNYNGLTGETYNVGEDVAPDRLLWTFVSADRAGTSYHIQSNDGRYLNGSYVSNDTGGYDGTLSLDSFDDPSEADVWTIVGQTSGNTVSGNLLKSTNASQGDAGDKYLSHGNGDNSVENIFTLRSDSNATSIVFHEYTDEGTYVSDPDNPITPDDPSVTGVRYEETDHFEAGKDYIIAAVKDDASVYAISKSSSSVSSATLSVTAASEGKLAYIATDSSSVVWGYSSSGYLENDGDYFYPTSSNGIMTYSSGRAITYADGKLSYETSSSGTYYVTCSDGSFGTSNSANSAATFRLFVKVAGSIITPDDPEPPAGGNVYKLVDELSSGKDYLIVDANAAGSAHALKNPGGTSGGASMGSASVTVASGDADGDGSADLYVQDDATDVVWRATANGEGFNLTNGDDFLEGKSGNVKIYSSQQYADRFWSYSDNQLKHMGGQSTYTVYYSNGFTSSTSSSSNKVYVYERVEQVQGSDPVEGVELDKSEMTLEEGKTSKLTATVSPATAADKSVAWESDDETVATVDSTGLVTAVKAGTAIITVTTTDGGKTASCTVTVEEPAPVEGTVYKLVDELASGRDYLIVDANAAGSAHALKNPGGTSGGASMGSASVTVASGDADGDGSADLYVQADATDVVWTATANGEGFNLTNGADYLEGASGEVKVFNPQQYAERYWTYSGNQLQHVGGHNTYTVYYSNGFTSTYNSTSEKVYVYEKVDGEPIQPEEFTITYELYGGTLPDGAPMAYTSETEDISLPTPSRPDYVFCGWYDAEGAAVTTIHKGSKGNKTFYAKWAREKYAVQFVNEDGTVLQSGDVTYNTMPVYTGQTPTKAGDAQYSYAFNGWEPELALVTEDATYTATYAASVNEYAVTFATAHGAAPATQTVAYGETAEEPDAPEAEGYEFGGWFADEGLEAAFDFGKPIVGAATAYAKWTPVRYSIAYNLNGGALAEGASNPESYTVESGAIALANPARTGYTFAGWAGTGIDGASAQVTIAAGSTGDREYTATWTINKYTIQFVDENGESRQTSIVEYGKLPQYTGYTPTKAEDEQYRYLFAGWTPMVVAATEDATYTVVFHKIARSYGDPAWAWTGTDQEGYTEAIARFKTNDGFAEFIKLIEDEEIDEVSTSPTCETAGITVYTAEVTFNDKAYVAEKKVESPATGHDWGEVSYVWSDNDKSVTATRVCKNDATHVETETVETMGETTNPTCEAAGKTVYTASFENEVFESQMKTVTIDAAGHNLTAIAEKAPTCEAAGNSAYWSCSVCGKLFSDAKGTTAITEADAVVAELGHSWDGGKVTKQPTCTEAGVRTFTCRNDASHTRTEAVAMIDHTWSAWKVVEQATDTSVGKKERTCSSCGKVEHQDIPKLDKAPLPTVVSGNISPANPVSAEVVAKQITATKSDADQKGSTFGLLQASGIAKSNSSVLLTWKEVPGATAYAIYGSKCGNDNKYKLIKTVQGTSFTNKKLKKGTYYRYVIVALEGEAALATSKTIYVATKGGKTGNSKSVKVTTPKKAKATMKVGKTLKVKVNTVAQSKKQKVKSHRKVAYETSDPNVATVSAKGKVKAVGKGTCYIYAYAQNGKCAKVKVTIK